MSYYNVYRVASAGLPRDHHSIFVETHPDQSGYRFQVTGNIQQGITFGHRVAKKSEDSSTFAGETILLGRVAQRDYPNRIREVVETIPPPKKQFEGPRRLYPKETLYRCQEWTRDAIQLLKDEGILI